ncbi:TPA: phosphatidate cytidylyltransferase, partial [Streptococcus agalactiae]
MKERVIWGAVALAIFIPFLVMGGLPFQFLV